MTAKPWDAENASRSDQAAHLARTAAVHGAQRRLLGRGIPLPHHRDWAWAGRSAFSRGTAKRRCRWSRQALFAVAILFGVWLVAPKAWSSARRLSPDMNLLMVVAVAGAIGLGEFFEAATVAFFFSLSLYLESWSVGRASNAVSALSRSRTPDGPHDPR